jgi:hypothetical protein
MEQHQAKPPVRPIPPTAKHARLPASIQDRLAEGRPLHPGSGAHAHARPSGFAPSVSGELHGMARHGGSGERATRPSGNGPA